LTEILKVPIEIYQNDDLQYVENLIKTKEILVYLYKEICHVDLISIFKEEIKKSSFNFEKFMMFPNIYNIFTVYLNRLFNAFASLNVNFNLEIKEYREILLKELNEIKLNFVEYKGGLFKNMLKFFEQFLRIVSLKIPIKNKNIFTIKQNSLFESKLNEIYSRTNTILKDLLILFESTGLIKYMQKDVDIMKKYKNEFEMKVDKQDYLIVKGNLNEILNGEDDDTLNCTLQLDDETFSTHYHIKMSYLEKILENNDLLMKKRKTENLELYEKNKEKKTVFKKLSLIEEKSLIRMRNNLKTTEPLSLNPAKLSFISN
jgi:hypothetical protein